MTPPTLLEHDLRTGARRVLKRRPVLDHPVHGPYRSEDYVQTRTWATAEDGTRVPISLVHRREVPLDGSAPALLYGYGSYEISIDPTFSTMRLSLLDRGFVYAIAHVRGGGELGRAWYEQGNRLHKRNSFTDFIACAHHLVAEGYTAPDRLVAEGGSAGGLLMGAVANLAPPSVRRDPRLGALRRCADHDPGSEPAADGHRVGGVGAIRCTIPRCTRTCGGATPPTRT